MSDGRIATRAQTPAGERRRPPKQRMTEGWLKRTPHGVEVLPIGDYQLLVML